jgi:hypothetical protein
MPTDDKRVAALLREREGLVQRGLDERIAQVDAEIRSYGGEPPADEPEGRQAPPQQTADDGPKPTAAKPGTRRTAK